VTGEQLDLWGEPTRLATPGSPDSPQPSAPGAPAVLTAVLALVSQRRYAVLAGATDVVWIDGHGNWCFRDLPDEHLPLLLALRDQDVLAVSARARSVRLADQPVHAQPFELTSAGRAQYADFVAEAETDALGEGR
jgi:hypothetical protein